MKKVCISKVRDVITKVILGPDVFKGFGTVVVLGECMKHSLEKLISLDLGVFLIP